MNNMKELELMIIALAILDSEYSGFTNLLELKGRNIVSRSHTVVDEEGGDMFFAIEDAHSIHAIRGEIAGSYCFPCSVELNDTIKKLFFQFVTSYTEPGDDGSYRYTVELSRDDMNQIYSIIDAYRL